MAAREVDKLLEEAKRALANHNHYKARLAMVEAQRLAAQIVAKLVAVEADRSEICEQCPYRWGNEDEANETE